MPDIIPKSVSAALDIKLEAVLFSAAEPLALTGLAKALGVSTSDVQAAIAVLQHRLNGGIRLAKAGNSYRLVTAPEAAAAVRAFLEDSSRSDLSRPALETLSIVAYRGPVTKSAVEAIRGVNSESMIRNLLARGLIVEAGHSNEPGQPTQYAVSHAFLQHFGLTSTDDLPPLPKGGKHEN